MEERGESERIALLDENWRLRIELEKIKGDARWKVRNSSKPKVLLF
jgi:hypothetical protein